MMQRVSSDLLKDLMLSSAAIKVIYDTFAQKSRGLVPVGQLAFLTTVISFTYQSSSESSSSGMNTSNSSPYFTPCISG